MSRKYLYEKLFEEIGRRSIKEITIPKYVIDNLNPTFELREYQKETFQRFICYFENSFNFKEIPNALLFNMATGSGKTLIMAGLILYLYEKGYRNFLFFVNSNNIIEKTRDNFLKQSSIKHLFNKELNFNGRKFRINEVDNFVGANINDINICFTTIQKLHSDLIVEKENAITFGDFKNFKIVMVADEAHHAQVKTKQKRLNGNDEKPNWENTVDKIHKQNNENILLEFTATMDFLDNDIEEKYENRLLYKYDLKEFRNDGFSKEVSILRTDTDMQGRMLIAILMNQYRQDVASKHKINNFKPVILFKSREIDESYKNQEIFHKLVENLSQSDLLEVKNKTNIPEIKKIFKYYEANTITLTHLIERIKQSFDRKYCVNVNEENLDKVSLNEKIKSEIITQQHTLNSLEAQNNPIRAIFEVKKLDEGWDVLNLFDIVRLSEKRDAKGNKPGKSTVSEAQLIGRGARYYPFSLNGGNNKYKRKFDSDVGNELRIIEELYFHSYDDSRYIAELKQILTNQGIIDDQTVEKVLKLKDNFKKTKFYKYGKVYLNDFIKNDYSYVSSFDDLGATKKDYNYELRSYKGSITQALTDEKYDNSSIQIKAKSIKLSAVEKHVLKNALLENTFFNYENISKYFKKLESIDDLVKNDNYFPKIVINFKGPEEEVANITNSWIYAALSIVLSDIETRVRGNIIDYKGTEEFISKNISEIFYDKILKLKKGSDKENGDEDLLRTKDWYVFNANYGTSEEKACVKLIDRLIEEEFSSIYSEIYLIRNELHFKIYNFSDGQAFSPDFVLFLKNKKGEELTYQIFVEAKGEYLQETDKWKEDFLLEIKEKFSKKGILKFIENEKYAIFGLPFYSESEENKFKEELIKVIT